MRLIDADALLEKKQERDCCFTVTEWDILNAPTVAPMKYGKWEEIHSPYIQKGAHKRKCTNCGECTVNIAEPLNYCPNCGARMEK